MKLFTRVTLWGFQFPHTPKPIALCTGPAKSVEAEQRHVRSQGWTTQIVNEGVTPHDAIRWAQDAQRKVDQKEAANAVQG